MKKLYICERVCACFVMCVILCHNVVDTPQHACMHVKIYDNKCDCIIEI